MMRPRVLLLVLALTAWAAPALAQTPATYAQRATFGQSAAWQGRITVAMINGALTVIAEDAATESHAQRLRLSAAVLKEPAFIAQRLAVVLAAAAPVVDTAGVVDTTLTDAQLQALVNSKWTAFAAALVTP